jgi:glycosyltransferase involved in cell wall biosynthesis
MSQDRMTEDLTSEDPVKNDLVKKDLVKKDRGIQKLGDQPVPQETLSINRVELRYENPDPHADAADPEFTILMPCLNESETLETCIRKAQGFLEVNHVRGEIIVSDNGSTDGSQEIARSRGAKVVDVPIRGYGAALIYGSSEARGKYIIMGDSDDSYDFADLGSFVQKLRAGNDLVMGNRLMGRIKPGAMPWKNRWIGTPALSVIGRIFFRCPVGDFNCGLRGFSADAFRKMKLRTTGMEFASEMIVKATLLKLRITEVPTTLSPDGRTRAPHLRPWRDGWRHLRFMLLCSPRWLFLYPGFVLMLAGLVSGALLLPGPRTIGRITLDIHTLFFSAIGVLLGFQAILFAVFSKTFAIADGLLPPDRKMDRLFRVSGLELWLGVGAVLVALGLLGAISRVMFWERHSFGSLDPTHVMRVAIPSGLSLALGFQTILSAFFLSLLRMGRK